MDSRLDDLQRYIVSDYTKDSEDKVRAKLSPSPKLLRVWKAVRGKEKNPLLDVLEGIETNGGSGSNNKSMPNKATDKSNVLSLSSLPDESIDLTSILFRLRQMDARLESFEKSYSLMPMNPQVTLQHLRSSLYNYETALVAGTHRLLHFYELPFQWRENKFIVYGYRFSKSHQAAFQGIFHWHNETANIWTHLLGSMFVLWLAFFHYPSTEVYAKSSTADKFAVYVFLAAAVKCLLFSVIWHTYANISTLQLRKRFACFDYTGITVLIIASIMTTEHIALRHYPMLRTAYLGFSFLTGIAGVLFSWSPEFDKPDSRIVRICFFLGLAALGATAFFTSSAKQGFLYSLDLYSPLLVSFVWYLVGIVFYGCLIPERWRSDVVIDTFTISDESIMKLDKAGKLQQYLDKQPEKTSNYGKFRSLWWVDYICSSHNFWHMFVLLGIIGHYYATLWMFAKVL